MQEVVDARMTLYVSERCALCENAVRSVRALSQEFGVPYTIISVDTTSAPHVPAVPAVWWRGGLYVGSRFPARLRQGLSAVLWVQERKHA